MPLTDTAIRKAKSASRTQRLFDGGGMYLEITPAGGKWWRLKYRVGGKEKRLSLGTYPDTGLAAARVRREEARKLLASGIDPSEQRKQVKQEQIAAVAASGETFKSVAREWMSRQTVARVTADKNRWLLETFLFP
ncbi:Arm DNA-binding domain-containing protein, partial [Xanthomonas albilineans]